MGWSDYIAILSLVVSTGVGIAFGYREFFYINRQLLFRPAGGYLGPEGFTLQVVAINSGNRPVIVMAILMSYWDKQKKVSEPPSWKNFSYAAPFEPVVLQPGSIVTVEQAYRVTDQQLYESGEKSADPARPNAHELSLGIHYEVLDDTGSRWASDRWLGSADVDIDSTQTSGFSVFVMTDGSKPYHGLTNKIEPGDRDVLGQSRD